MKQRPVALVTGAGCGIGRGIAVALAKHGFNIAGNDILWEPENTAEGLFEVRERALEFGAAFVPVRGDIARLEDHGVILSSTLDAFGRLDLLVNNAGIAPETRVDILETTPESFDRLFAVNTRGAFFLTQAVANHMIARRNQSDAGSLHPCIVFITSISAAVSSPSRAEYCISKAALSHASGIFADRLIEYGIRVYEIRPGIIDTEMTAPVHEYYDRRIAEGLVPQKRWGRPEDIGKIVVALARGDFDYAPGHIFEVSGGMQIRHL
jgi:NAD(P)-dependent dehydrogenase (short-subunit alcohol dehydrogenase family)